MTTNYYILNEVLDIVYLDKDNKSQNKQITINKKTIVDDNNIDILKKNLENYLIIIYDNNTYLNNIFEKNYEYIIKSNLEEHFTLKYATKYFYLDYY